MYMTKYMEINPHMLIAEDNNCSKLLKSNPGLVHLVSSAFVLLGKSVIYIHIYIYRR